MSGTEPLLAAEAATAVTGAEAATASAEALAAMEAATAAEAASAASAMEAANTAATASSAINPYIMSSADKAAMFGNAGYGPGMSGFQTSVFDTTLQATGSPQIASLLSNLAPGQQMATRLGASAIQQAMRPHQQTTVGAQIRRGQISPIQSLLVEAQRRKRRNLSLL